jgi:nitroimidazol reductase NimA-like FMN-containing flavoprotein (pyridoxamine 5'-phosphate oxidase superfamily)
MSNPRQGKIRELSRFEIDELLARNSVGRLAFARNNRLSLTPLSYVYEKGWIYGRTSFGQKMKDVSGSAYNWWPVIFEVDEVESAISWRSVVVHGGLNILGNDGGSPGNEQWQHAVEIIRGLIPNAWTENDPMPRRNMIFRISTSDATGREAT